MNDGWWERTLLIASTGEEPVDVNELRELVLREEAEEARRKDVRMPAGEKRERMDWKREVCILADLCDRQRAKKVSGFDSFRGKYLDQESLSWVAECGMADCALIFETRVSIRVGGKRLSLCGARIEESEWRKSELALEKMKR